MSLVLSIRPMEQSLRQRRIKFFFHRAFLVRPAVTWRVPRPAAALQLVGLVGASLARVGGDNGHSALALARHLGSGFRAFSVGHV